MSQPPKATVQVSPTNSFSYGPHTTPWLVAYFVLMGFVLIILSGFVHSEAWGLVGKILGGLSLFIALLIPLAAGRRQQTESEKSNRRFGGPEEHSQEHSRREGPSELEAKSTPKRRQHVVSSRRNL